MVNLSGRMRDCSPINGGRSSLSRFVHGQWQVNSECRPNADSGFDANGTAAGFDHALYDRKAQPASRRRLFLLSAKERIERLPNDRRGHAGAVIRNAELVGMG